MRVCSSLVNVLGVQGYLTKSTALQVFLAVKNAAGLFILYCNISNSVTATIT